MEYNQIVPLSDIVGKTIINAELKCIDSSDNNLLFLKCLDGSEYEMGHIQDCCEYVYLDDICPSLDILQGKVIDFTETSNSDDTEWGTRTWTFYNINTEKGSCTLRWCGTSNGYYSESVNFFKIKEGGD